MGDTKTTLTWLLKDEVSGSAKKITGKLDDAGLAAKNSGGLMGGLSKATGGLVTPFSLALAGVTALVGGLTLAIKAAADEQKNVEKLSAALTANVPSWNGNTDAIEEQIAAREDLAFSDDALRDSLAILVTSTKDVTEAQNLQAIAMDLARFKGIDLATASTAVAKASQGSTREIKALGLELDDSATATENLLTIQKATAGQAEGYAKTMAGKWETFNNKLGDVVEAIGGALLPIIEGAMDFLLTTAIPAIGQMADLLGPILTPIVKLLGAAFTIAGKAVSWVIDHVVKPAIDTVVKLIGFVHDALRAIGLLNDTPVSSGVTDGWTGKRAAGGPVGPGGTYLVGENGPETLVMGQGSGTVTPNGGGSSGSPVEIVLTLDGREISRVVDRRLYLSLAGAGGSSRPR